MTSDQQQAEHGVAAEPDREGGALDGQIPGQPGIELVEQPGVHAGEQHAVDEPARRPRARRKRQKCVPQAAKKPAVRVGRRARDSDR